MLRKLRIARGLTQEALADAAACSLRTISAMETGRPASHHSLLAVAKALGVEAAALVEEQDESEAKTDPAPPSGQPVRTRGGVSPPVAWSEPPAAFALRASPFLAYILRCLATVATMLEVEAAAPLVQTFVAAYTRCPLAPSSLPDDVLILFAALVSDLEADLPEAGPVAAALSLELAGRRLPNRETGERALQAFPPEPPQGVLGNLARGGPRLRALAWGIGQHLYAPHLAEFLAKWKLQELDLAKAHNLCYQALESWEKFPSSRVDFATLLFRMAINDTSPVPRGWPTPRPLWVRAVSNEELQLLDRSLELDPADRLLLCLFLYTPLGPGQFAAVQTPPSSSDRVLEQLVQLVDWLLRRLFVAA